MPATTIPPRGCCPTQPGRATSTSVTAQSLTSSPTATTTSAATSPLAPQAADAQGLGACFPTGEVGQVPCTAQGEGHPRAEGDLRSPCLSTLTGLAGTTLALALALAPALALHATRCRRRDHSCGLAHAPAHPSLVASRASPPWGAGARCLLAAEAEP